MQVAPFASYGLQENDAVLSAIGVAASLAAALLSLGLAVVLYWRKPDDKMAAFVPYAAIALREGTGFKIVAEYGLPTSPPRPASPRPGVEEWGVAVRPGGEVFPLLYQSEILGQLVIAPRAPDEPFTPAERRLLEDIAHQAGVAAHAVRLTADLQHSRERLVTAREEERRRLRRDLHDGLGLSLASQTLKLDAARAMRGWGRISPHSPSGRAGSPSAR